VQPHGRVGQQGAAVEGGGRQHDLGAALPDQVAEDVAVGFRDEAVQPLVKHHQHAVGAALNELLQLLLLHAAGNEHGDQLLAQVIRQLAAPGQQFVGYGSQFAFMRLGNSPDVLMFHAGLLI